MAKLVWNIWVIETGTFNIYIAKNLPTKKEVLRKLRESIHKYNRFLNFESIWDPYFQHHEITENQFIIVKTKPL